MKINKFTTITPAHWELLLDADPAKKIVKDYTSRGTCFELKQNGELAGVIVLLATRPETVEIMNLAVAKKFRGQKLAQKMIAEALNWSKQEPDQLELRNFTCIKNVVFA